jgi:nitroreductase
MPGNEMYDPAARDASDTLDGDPGEDPLDQGIAPPDRWSAGEGYGTTAAEQEQGESLDELLAEEEPEPDPYAEAETEDDRRYGSEPEARAGRLVAPDEGAHPDAEADLVAQDVGIDAGAASAEEAAVHEDDEEEG